MPFLSFTLGPFETNSYLVFCPETRKGIIIDPSFGGETILRAVQREKLDIVHIVNTHGHIDHTCGNRLVREATGAGLLIHRDDSDILLYPDEEFLLMLGLEDYTPLKPDGFIEEGQEVGFGEESLRVIHTPGHTPGGICLLDNGILFTGDTLFAGSVGRTDLFGGDERALLESLQEKVLPLPDEIEVYPGHGPATTVGQERRTNPSLVESF